DIEEPAEACACKLRGERKRAAARLHSAPAHVFAERRHRELLRDLPQLHVRAAAAAADEVALARKVVERGAKREARDTEVGAQLALGWNRRADPKTVDQLEHLLARRVLLRHLLRGGDTIHGLIDYRTTTSKWSMPLLSKRECGIDSLIPRM